MAKKIVKKAVAKKNTKPAPKKAVSKNKPKPVAKVKKAAKKVIAKILLSKIKRSFIFLLDDVCCCISFKKLVLEK